MAMKRCPVCGEKFSDTYKNCPFCEEEAALREGDKLRRGGKRTAHGRQYSLITPTLVILILIMAGLLIYLLYGDKIAGKLKREEQTEPPATEEVVPVKPGQEGTGEGEGTGEETPEDTTPEGTENQNQSGTATTQSDYEKAASLPDGLTLSTTDFTLKSVGETHTIQVSGGSGSYTWISEDAGIASVDGSGKVTAVSRGTVNVLVTDGSKKAVCIVRCNVTGSAAATTTTPSSGNSGATTTSGSGSLKAGSAVVVNGGNGVRVRSGPGTEHEALATVPNGASVQIVESAGNGWYKITFSGVGGVNTTGYMKGEFLENR